MCQLLACPRHPRGYDERLFRRQAVPTLKANGIDLYYEAKGADDAPAILLVMGLGTQMIAWPERFVDGLVAAGYRVIQFDNRDIGKSTRLDGAFAVHPIRAIVSSRLRLRWPVAYRLSDMAKDAVALLDALNVPAAHVVGVSMGGMIAQHLAATHADRVLSLTSIMSSSGAPGLPGAAKDLTKRLLARRPAKITRDIAVVGGAEMLRAIAYPDPARPDSAFADMAGRAFDRGYNPMGVRRQLLAIIADGSRAALLDKIRVPTLVVHGSADRLVPLANGEDVARRVMGARMEVIDAMAHDLPPSQVDRMVTLIVDHVGGVAAPAREAAAA